MVLQCGAERPSLWLLQTGENMNTFQIFRETALPGVLASRAIYLIAPSADAALVEIVVANADGSASRHVINKSDIQSMIDASMAASGTSDLIIVDDITDRDALTPAANVYAYVTDATGDTTVASGGATYLYNFATTTWLKVSESESMDVVMSWAGLSGKPTSAVADIDTAVAQRHTHANKTQLDKIGENGDGLLTYNGAQVKTEYSSTAW